MGLFNRKDSKSPRSDARLNDKDLLRPAVTADRLSGYSIQSPRLVNNTPGILSKMVTSIPDVDIPKPPDPSKKPADYLRSIHAVRDRSTFILQKAKANELNHFDVDLSKFTNTAEYVVSIIKRDFAGDYGSIPPHGRWQHFEVGGRPRVTQLLQSWPTSVDNQERARRLVDLFLVSVLLDAGAGTKWSYKSKESGKNYSRSEGLAVASLEMFKTGAFSSDKDQPHQVDARGLTNITVETLAKGMQVTDSNPMSGLDGRAGLLMKLATALQNSELFGADGRPGNMIGMDTLALMRLWLTTSRLSHITSHNTSIFGACGTTSNSVVSAYGWPFTHLASYKDKHRQRITWRCMAMHVNATITSTSSMGEHRPFPQADAMALLLHHGANDKATQHALRWCRTDDRSTRIQKRGTTCRYWPADSQEGRRRQRPRDIPQSHTR